MHMSKNTMILTNSLLARPLGLSEMLRGANAPSLHVKMSGQEFEGTKTKAKKTGAKFLRVLIQGKNNLRDRRKKLAQQLVSQIRYS